MQPITAPAGDARPAWTPAPGPASARAGGRRGVTSPWRAAVLVLGVLVVALNLLLGVRHASDDDLRHALSTRMPLVEVQHSDPSGFHRWLRSPLPDNDDPDVSDDPVSDQGTGSEQGVGPTAQGWLVWHDGPGHVGERWISVPDAARVLHVAPTDRAVLHAVYTSNIETGGMEWSVPGLVGIFLLLFLLRTPPRTGTRWFWFWVAGLPCCLGFLWYAVTECRATPTPARRRTGWWGLLVSVVLRSVILGLVELVRSHL